MGALEAPLHLPPLTVADEGHHPCDGAERKYAIDPFHILRHTFARAPASTDTDAWALHLAVDYASLCTTPRSAHLKPDHHTEITTRVQFGLWPTNPPSSPSQEQA
jgi:hypothetical protein